MSGPAFTITASGCVTYTDATGQAVTPRDLEQSLRRVADAARQGGASTDDVQAVLLFAGLVKAQARLVQRVTTLEPLAAPRVKFEAGRDIRNMGRGISETKKAEVRRLAKLHAPRFKSDRSLRAHIAKQTGLTADQVRQELNPPKRKAPRKKPKPKQRKQR